MDNRHPFEKALLGKAPFRCVRVEEIVHTSADGHTRAGTSCDFCFTSIRWAFFINSADGKEFKVGCDCVAKTHDSGLKSEVSKARREFKAETKRTALRVAAKERAAQFLAKHTGLETALKVEHPIIRDIGSKLLQYGSLSLRQVAFVFSLAEKAELAELDIVGCAQPPVLDVPSFEDRVQLVVKVLSTRLDEGRFGTTLKALYQVRTPEGCWKAWGTLPSGIRGEVKGNTYTIKTRVVPSKEDPKFGFFNRPTVVQLNS